MRFLVFRYRCENGHAFNRLGSPSESGVLLLRSTGSSTDAMVETYADPVFDGVSRLAAAVLAGVDDHRRGAAARNAFSITCDPDVDGSAFGIGVLPRCPTCGSSRIVWWESTDPPEVADVDLPAVTHTRWLSLTNAEREARLTQTLLQSIEQTPHTPSPS